MVNKNTKIIILAGGKGKRFNPFSFVIPKPLMPINQNPILMYLIKNNSASKTVTIFFLIPATTAIIAWIFLNEELSNLDIFGFLVASFGVYLATRKNIST